MILTYEQAAEELAISVRTIHRLVADGKLPYIKIGRSKRISKTGVEDFVYKHRVVAESESCRTEKHSRKTGTSHGRKTGSNVHDLVKRLTSRKPRD